jgi:hypothetical protein
LTSRYMLHNAESWLCAMQHSAESWLCAEQLLSWINSWFMNISYYIILLVLFRDVHLWIIFCSYVNQKFLAKLSWFYRWLPAVQCPMQHSAESTHFKNFLCEIETEFKHILGFYQGPRVHRFMKKWRSKILCYCLFKVSKILTPRYAT